MMPTVTLLVFGLLLMSWQWSVVTGVAKSPFVNIPNDTWIRGHIYERPYSISKTADKAIAILKERKPSSGIRLRSERLAVMIVFNYPLHQNGSHHRLGSLVCAINKINTNIAPYTPVDVFVWMNATSLPLMPGWFATTFPDVVILPIDQDSWLLPEGLSPMDNWTYGDIFSLDYHLMGRWRLTFAFDFVRALGYQYMLQMDDDLFVVESVTFNIVQTFRERRIAYALRDRIVQEEAVVVLGLPELAKYWMSSTRLEAPLGPLLDHVSPPDTTGISGAGWDRHIASASFMVWDVDFWFEPAVQDFLNLAFSTGADLMQRWLEQELQNMLHLLFLPEKHVHRFPVGLAVHHKVRDAAVLRLLQCDSVTIPANLVRGQSSLMLGLDGVVPAPGPIEVVPVQSIEFLVAWQVGSVGRDAEELTLFRWRYRPASCGADTPQLNDYAQYVDTVHKLDAALRIYPDKWYAYAMGDKLAALRDTSGIDPSAMTAQQCQETIRQQLQDFVVFYTIGYGTDRHEAQLSQMATALYSQALGHFELHMQGLGVEA